MRRAATEEGVQVIGTIWLLDQLYKDNYIATEEFRYCLVALLENNEKKVRLPERELISRIEQVDNTN